jgi:hypothetical protein
MALNTTSENLVICEPVHILLAMKANQRHSVGGECEMMKTSEWTIDLWSPYSTGVEWSPVTHMTYLTLVLCPSSNKPLQCKTGNFKTRLFS